MSACPACRGLPCRCFEPAEQLYRRSFVTPGPVASRRDVELLLSAATLLATAKRLAEDALRYANELEIEAWEERATSSVRAKAFTVSGDLAALQDRLKQLKG